MSDAYDFGPRAPQEPVLAFLARVPPNGGIVHLQGDLARAALGALQAGVVPDAHRLAIPEDRAPPDPDEGEQGHGVSVVHGRRLAWVSQILDERHRPLQARRRALGLKVGEPWINLWIQELDLPIRLERK